MRITDVGINYRPARPVTRGWAAGHSGTVLELPCSDLQRPILKRSKQVEERKPGGQNELQSRGWMHTNVGAGRRFRFSRSSQRTTWDDFSRRFLSSFRVTWTGWTIVYRYLLAFRSKTRWNEIIILSARRVKFNTDRRLARFLLFVGHVKWAHDRAFNVLTIVL